MKVLHIGKYFPPRYGGIETFMSQLMEEQVNQGLEVSALVHADSLQSKSGEYTWKGCKVIEAKSYGQFIFAPVSPIYPIRLIKAIKNVKPDILHIHMPNLSAFWLLLVNKLSLKNSKLIVHWHSDVLGAEPNFWVRMLYPVYRVFEKAMLNTVDTVVVTSPPYLDTSEPLLLFREKCHVIPLGIQLNNSDIPIKQTFNFTEKLKLVMISRLSYYKGHQVVFEALKVLSDKGGKFELHIVGAGELKESLNSQLKKLSLEDSVHWYGEVSVVEKETLLSNSDILLLPSLERTEAFGVVLLEAAKFKVPAIVSDVIGSGMSWVVDNGKTGLVVQSNNPIDLANTIQEVDKHRGMLQSMGENAFQKLRKNFNIRVVTKDIISIYDH